MAVTRDGDGPLATELPMTYAQWSETTGAVSTVFRLVEDDPDSVDRLVEIESGIPEDAAGVARAMVAAYYDYICAFIASDRAGRSEETP